jgi:hypothetical protein
LLFGVRNVEQSSAADAAGWLQQAVAAPAGGRFGWVAELKPVAQKYLDDCKLYLDWKKEGEQAKDPAAISRHLENTRSLIASKKFKTRSPLVDEVAAEEKALARERTDQQKADENKRAEQQKKQAEQSAQDVARRKPQWLLDWKNQLINDLNRAHYKGAVTDAAGMQYSGIVRATSDNLIMQVPYGELALAWSRISPAVLLKISTSFIDPKAADAADRSWRCAVYANETGQTDEAKRLGGDAAKSKPEYSQMLPVLQSQPKR